MQYFIKKCLIFILIGTASILVPFILFFHPFAQTVLGAITDKHQLLQNSSSPRIIFVGGSNVSFGLDSKKISEHFKMPVVNMGIVDGLGLKFEINDLKQFLKDSDIIVLAPEYDQYESEDDFNGNVYLAVTILDIDRQGYTVLDLKQKTRILKLLPAYLQLKFRAIISNFVKKNLQKNTGVYSRNSFNEYGDAYLHWNLPNEDFSNRYRKKAGSGNNSFRLNAEAIDSLKAFKEFVESKKGKFLLLPPAHDGSIINNKGNGGLDSIAHYISINGMGQFYNNERYQFPHELFFNTDYHLNKQGVDIRTKFVIEDLDKVLK